MAAARLCRLGFAGIASFLLASGVVLPGPSARADAPERRAVLRLPLVGPLAASEAEISGLAWLDTQAGPASLLLILAEGPLDFPNGVRTPIAILRRADIVRAVREVRSGEPSQPLEPLPIELDLSSVSLGSLENEGRAGFEAIGTAGARIALAFEPGDDRGGSLLLEGRWRGKLGVAGGPTVAVDRARWIAAPALAPPVSSERLRSHRINKSFESILALPDAWLLLHECGGAVRVHRNGEIERSPFALPYRVTDATSLGRDGLFWVMNYRFIGEECDGDPPTLAEDLAANGTPPGGAHIERIVPLRWRTSRLEAAGEAPIPLALEEEPRNWEGLVRFADPATGSDGFLLATDRYPIAAGTILAYVDRQPLPRSEAQ